MFLQDFERQALVTAPIGMRQDSRFQQVFGHLRLGVRHGDGLLQAPEADVVRPGCTVQAIVDFECLKPEFVSFGAPV